MSALCVPATLLQGLAYVAALALLFERPQGRRLLGALAPIGRMALTNYLAQSVLYVVVLSGLGLAGKVSYAWVVPGAVVFYTLQVLFSRAWLRRFRFGPVEWLWRSLTYGRVQPLRHGLRGR